MNAIFCATERPNTYRHRIEIRAHELHADLLAASGGEDSAPGPHDYFDASLASCKALTAMWYAKKNGFPLERVEAAVERDDSEERKGKYKLLVRLAFHGPLTDEQRTRLYAAVARCPVAKLMTDSEVAIETLPLDTNVRPSVDANVRPSVDANVRPSVDANVRPSVDAAPGEAT